MQSRAAVRSWQHACPGVLTGFPEPGGGLLPRRIQGDQWPCQLHRRRVCSAEARRAGLNNRVAISNANRSSVSSTATASRCRTTATSVAVLFGSLSRASAVALLPIPVRASTCSRFVGMSCTSTRPTSSSAIRSAHCRALIISGPELRRGDWRRRSSADTRGPSGTFNSSTS